MTSKITSSTSLNSVDKKGELKQEEKKPQHLAEVLNVSCDEQILEFIQKKIDKKKVEEPSQNFCKNMKKALDKNFGKEWNVFIGGHFSGSVGAVANGYVELIINKSLKVVIFKTFSG